MSDDRHAHRDGPPGAARRCATRSLRLLAALIALVRSSPATGDGRACVDPCVQSARAEHRDCVAIAADAFTEATDACVARDVACVDACGVARQACRDDTGEADEFLACEVERIRAKAECRDRFPIGSTLRVICLDRADLAAFRCRLHVRRSIRRGLRACRTDFRQCAGACSPGAPPEGVQTCLAEGKSAFATARSACRLTFNVSASACLDKDLACVVACGDDRD